MTVENWVKIGIDSGAVTALNNKPCTFRDAYHKWFVMKMHTIKAQSLDRIEVTYRRYYASDAIVLDDVSVMDTVYVSDWLNKLLLSLGCVTFKEFGRIFQIINNVLVYALDLDLGNARLIDWNLIKRYAPTKCISDSHLKSFAISDDIIHALYENIVLAPIYPLKQSACLCLLLNFSLGLRIGELASLMWSDIDFANKVVRVFKTESKCFERDLDGNRTGTMLYLVKNEVKTVYSMREVPLSNNAISLLLVLQEHHRSLGYVNEYLCFDGVEQGVLIRSLDRTLRKLCVLCGIPHFSSHMIRKSFASKLHDAGVPTRAISDILGHADMKTTEKHYVLSYEDKWSKLRSTLNDILKY